jgi:F0F1-type ATP synthase membrane subunit b/b'
MAKTQTDTHPTSDEFSRIFSEYRARIDEISRRTEKRLKSLNVDQEEVAEALGEILIEDLPEGPPHPPAEVRPEEREEEKEEEEAQPTPEDTRPHLFVESPEPEKPPIPESAAIIREARQKAKRIIEEAEQKVKKEAKKKTQSQVDKLLEKAGKEAEDIVAAARELAEREKSDIIAISRQEAEQVITEITEKCRQESRSQSSETIAQARRKAQKIMADVIESGTEINRLIADIIERAEKTVAEFESRLREETGDLARIITETREKLDQVTAAAREEEARSAAPALNGPNEIIDSPTLAVRFLGERSNGTDGTSALFQGQVEIKSSSAIDYQYLKSLKKHLVSIPALKYLQEYASEKEMSVLFDIREPLPLLDLLRQVPLVEEVLPGVEDDFSIIFKDQN